MSAARITMSMAGVWCGDVANGRADGIELQLLRTGDTGQGPTGEISTSRAGRVRIPTIIRTFFCLLFTAAAAAASAIVYVCAACARARDEVATIRLPVCVHACDRGCVSMH